MPNNTPSKVSSWDEEVTDIAPKKVDSWDEEVSNEPVKKKEPTQFMQSESGENAFQDGGVQSNMATPLTTKTTTAKPNQAEKYQKLVEKNSQKANSFIQQAYKPNPQLQGIADNLTPTQLNKSVFNESVNQGVEYIDKTDNGNSYQKNQELAKNGADSQRKVDVYKKSVELVNRGIDPTNDLSNQDYVEVFEPEKAKYYNERIKASVGVPDKAVEQKEILDKERKGLQIKEDIIKDEFDDVSDNVIEVLKQNGKYNEYKAQGLNDGQIVQLAVDTHAKNIDNPQYQAVENPLREDLDRLLELGARSNTARQDKVNLILGERFKDVKLSQDEADKAQELVDKEEGYGVDRKGARIFKKVASESAKILGDLPNMAVSFIDNNTGDFAQGAMDKIKNFTLSASMGVEANDKKVDEMNPTKSNKQLGMMSEFVEVNGNKVFVDDNGNATEVRDKNNYKLFDQKEVDKTLETFNSLPKKDVKKLSFGENLGLATNKVGETLIDMASLVGTTAMGGGSRLASMMAINGQMYNGLVEHGLSKGLTREEAENFGFLASNGIALASMFNPMEAKVASNLLNKGVKNEVMSGAELITKGLNSKNYKEMAAKFAKGFVEANKSGAKEGVEESVLEPFAQYLVEKSYDERGKGNFTPSMKQDAETWAVSYGTGAIMGGAEYATRQNDTEAEKNAVYQAIISPEALDNYLASQKSLGLISDDKIEAIKDRIGKVRTDLEGLDVSEADKRELAVLFNKKSVYNEKLKTITNEVVKKNVKAESDKIDEEVEAILTKEPKQETPTEEVKVTNPQDVVEPTKVVEEVAQTEEVKPQIIDFTKLKNAEDLTEDEKLEVEAIGQKLSNGESLTDEEQLANDEYKISKAIIKQGQAEAPKVEKTKVVEEVKQVEEPIKEESLKTISQEREDGTLIPISEITEPTPTEEVKPISESETNKEGGVGVDVVKFKDKLNSLKGLNQIVYVKKVANNIKSAISDTLKDIDRYNMLKDNNDGSLDVSKVDKSIKMKEGDLMEFVDNYEQSLIDAPKFSETLKSAEPQYNKAKKYLLKIKSEPKTEQNGQTNPKGLDENIQPSSEGTSEVVGETDKGKIETSFDKAMSASSRFRPYETVVFDKPIIGKNGNKLISYQWAYEWTMQQSKTDSELKSKRISDWTQAESSAETGRDIVHKFTVERKDGTIVTVSSETIPSLLGYVDEKQMKNFPSIVSSVKTLAKQRMQLAILEAQEKEYNELRSKYEKETKPKIEANKMTSDNAPTALKRFVGEGNLSRTIFTMGDVSTTQDNPHSYDSNTGKMIFTENNIPSKYTIEYLESYWVQKRIKDNGGKYPNGIYDLRRRIERQEKKVEQATGSKISPSNPAITSKSNDNGKGNKEAEAKVLETSKGKDEAGDKTSDESVSKIVKDKVEDKVEELQDKVEKKTDSVKEQNKILATQKKDLLTQLEDIFDILLGVGSKEKPYSDEIIERIKTDKKFAHSFDEDDFERVKKAGYKVSKETTSDVNDKLRQVYNDTHKVSIEIEGDGNFVLNLQHIQDAISRVKKDFPTSVEHKENPKLTPKFGLKSYSTSQEIDAKNNFVTAYNSGNKKLLGVFREELNNTIGGIEDKTDKELFDEYNTDKNELKEKLGKTTPSKQKSVQKIIDFFNDQFGFKGFAPLSEFESKLKELKGNETELTTQSGQVLGFVSNGKIYLNPEVLSEETTFHELSHVQQAMIKIASEKGDTKAKAVLDAWNKVVSDNKIMEQMKGFDKTENPLKASIIGEKGAKNLPNAQKALSDLDLAKKMESEGKTPKEIWDKTSWEKGADGKWRYYFSGKIELSPKFVKSIDEVVKTNESQTLPITDVLSGEILTLYPKLKDAEVIIYYSNNGRKGDYNPKTNTLTINLYDTEGSTRTDAKGNEERSGRMANEIIGTLVHEYQHFIQEQENFGRSVVQERAVQYINERFGYSLTGEDIDRISDYDSKISELINNQKYDEADKVKKERDNFVDKIHIDNNIPLNELEAYMRSIGEVEARNAKNRYFSTDRDNLEKSISETEDTPRSKQILFATKGGKETKRILEFGGQKIDLSSSVYSQGTNESDADYEQRIMNEIWSYLVAPENAKKWNVATKGSNIKNFIKAVVDFFREKLGLKDLTDEQILNSDLKTLIEHTSNSLMKGEWFELQNEQKGGKSVQFSLASRREDLVKKLKGIYDKGGEQAVIDYLTQEEYSQPSIDRLVKDVKGYVEKDVKTESKKLSVAKRVVEGENEDALKFALQKSGITYDVENWGTARQKAQDFINEYGLENAVQYALKENSELVGAPRAFVLGYGIEDLVSKRMKETDTDKTLDIIEQEAKLAKAFAVIAKTQGQFISSLQEIFKNSAGYYELGNILKDLEENYGEGNIPEEVKLKVAELTKQLEETEKELANARKKQQESEENDIIATFKERASKSKTKKAKELIAEGLEDLARAIGAIRMASGDKSASVTNALVKIGKGLIQGGVATTENVFDKILEYAKDKISGKDLSSYRYDVTNSIKTETIDENNISIPKGLVSELVNNGIDNIEDLTKEVKKAIESQYQNATERDIRDAITKYGKKLKEPIQTIQGKIGKMRRIGRLLSQLEDIRNNIRPTKNTIQRAKPSLAEQKLVDEIKRGLAEMGLSSQEIESKLQTLKDRAKKQIAEYEERIKKGEYQNKPKSPSVIDDELKKLSNKRNELRDKLDDIRYEAELQKEGKLKSLASGLWNLTRVLRATAELSTILMQGGKLVASNLVRGKFNVLGNAFTQMAVQFASEKVQKEYLSNLKDSEYYNDIVKSGLSITNPTGKESAREELLYDNLISKLLKNKYYDYSAVDVPQRIERGLGGFMNVLRVNAFLEARKNLLAEGKTMENSEKEYKDVADVLNTITGRSSLGKLGDSKVVAHALNIAFFSPKNWVSSLKMSTPYVLWWQYQKSIGQDEKPHFSEANKQYLKHWISHTAMALGIMALLSEDDDDDNITIEKDPRSSDFMKLKIGDVRLDPFNGQLQNIVLTTRVLLDLIGKKSYKDTKTGKEYRLGEEKGRYNVATMGELFTQIAKNKLSPSAKIVYDYVTSEPITRGENAGGRKDQFNNVLFDKDYWQESFLPIFWYNTLPELEKSKLTEEQKLSIIALSFAGLGSNDYSIQEKNKANDKKLKGNPYNKPKKLDRNVNN